MKHQQLLFQKAEIEEDLEDLGIKYSKVETGRFLKGAGYYEARKRQENIYKIVVVEARNLEVADILTGTSDPYTVMNYEGQVVKTTIKKTNLNPIWKESFEFERTKGKNVLELTVYDYDAYSRDDVIGEVDIELGDYPSDSQIYDKWFYLNDGDK